MSAPVELRIGRGLRLGLMLCALASLGLVFVQAAARRNGAPSGTAAPLDTTRHHGVCFVAGPAAPVDADFADLAAHGVTWVSQTPFGWQRRFDEPTFRMITDGRIYWGERDSGLVATARMARAHGITSSPVPVLISAGTRR